ncbi:MAG: HD domain-containing protein [Deltaproteobacteria bacterium]|nr:HD domain-containing protein [Deltaproteobacteria bacterium]
MSSSPPVDRESLLAFIGADEALTALSREAGPRLGDDPGHDLAHALRVALWTVRLGGARVDPREAVAAALLHDIVNLPKDSPERARASELSADEARRLLPPLGFDAEATERVARAVLDHSFSRGATPDHPLGRALQDADRLEAVGAIGIMRTISTGTRMGARYFHDDDPFAVRRSLDDRAFSIDHFRAKLLGLAETMLTDEGRAEARRRSRLMLDFLDGLAGELGVPLPASWRD